MMNKETFKEITERYKEILEYVDKLQELGINIYGSSLFHNIGVIFDQCIYTNFDKDASDLVMWWMFEPVEKELELDDGTIVNLENLDDFWQYMVSCGYVE